MALGTACQLLGLRRADLDPQRLKWASERLAAEIRSRGDRKEVERRNFDSMREARGVVLAYLEQIQRGGVQLALELFD